MKQKVTQLKPVHLLKLELLALRAENDELSNLVIAYKAGIEEYRRIINTFFDLISQEEKLFESVPLRVRLWALLFPDLFVQSVIRMTKSSIFERISQRMNILKPYKSM